MDWLKKLAYFNFEAFFFLLMGVISFAKVLFLLKRRNRLLRSGVVSDGEVVGFKYELSNKIFSRSPVIRFVANDGVLVEAACKVRADFTSYKKGMRVAVIYDPQKPKIFLLKDDDDSKVVSIMLFVAGFIMLFLAFRMFMNS